MRCYPENITRKYYEIGAWDGKTWNDYIGEHAARTPDKVAVVDQPNKEETMGVRPLRLTWKEFKTLVDRLALNFLEMGVRPEDVVFIQLPNCMELILAEMALDRIGAVGTFSPMRHRAAEVGYTIRKTEAKYAVCMEKYAGFDYLGMINKLRPECPTLQQVIVLAGKDPAGDVPLAGLLENRLEEKYSADYLDRFRPSPDDVLTLCLTTGTEALPKVVPRTPNSWKAITRALLAATGHGGETVFSGPFPYMNMGGLGVQLYPWIMAGGKFVVHDPFNVDIFLEQITGEKINYIIAVPAIYFAMLNHPELGKKYDISSLTVVGCGGEAPPHTVIEELDRRGIKVINEFGATEGWGFFTMPGQPVEERKDLFRLDKILQYLPGMEFKVIDPATAGEMPPGAEGELIVRGPEVFTGYLNAPEINERSFTKDGFFRTGDLACLNADQTLKYVGRVKDMIIRSGQNISPAEIELIIQYHPKVYEVSVIGMADPVRGQKVCAYVTPKPGETITLPEIVSFMREKQVASYKIPERLEIMGVLPKGPSGKILKRELREDLAEKLKGAG